MKIKPFALERYFAKYEFNTKHLLCSSECEPITLTQLLDMADEETMGLYNNLSLGYTESAGHPILLDEISKLYENISTNDILTIAPQEGIFIAMNCILDKSDHMISTFPGYQSLYEIGHSTMCDVSFWQARYNKDGAYFDINELKSLLKPNTKLLVVNFPHNPTGYSPTKSQFMEIINFAKENDLILLSDEMYHYLSRGEEYNLPHACDVYDKAISLFGLSKSFALPGLRIGWLCTKDEKMMDAFKKYRDYTTICSSAPSEILAIIALRAKERIITRNQRIIQDNIELLNEYFDKNKHIFTYYPPISGSTCYPKLRDDIDINEFCTDLVAKQEVMLLPCTVYGEANNRFRLGYGKLSMKTALMQLEKYTNKI